MLLIIKVNYLTMTNDEFDYICEWIDKNIGGYIGWNEWGSLRVINPDSFKKALINALKEKHYDNH